MTDAPTLLAIAKESRRLCKINKAMNCCDSCAKCAANIFKEEASDQFAPLHLCTFQARFFTAAYIALKCAFYWASNDRTTPCCLMVTTFCSGCIECGLFISLAGKDAPMCQQLLCLMHWCSWNYCFLCWSSTSVQCLAHQRVWQEQTPVHYAVSTYKCVFTWYTHKLSCQNHCGKPAVTFFLAIVY